MNRRTRRTASALAVFAAAIVAAVLLPNRLSCEPGGALRRVSVQGRLEWACLATNPKAVALPVIPMSDPRVPLRVGVAAGGLVLALGLLVAGRPTRGPKATTSLLAGAMSLMMLGLILAACTSSSPGRVAAIPATLRASPPRACPVGVGDSRGTRVASPAQMLQNMHGHVPGWLPSGFGLVGAWTAKASAWLVWSDRHCRGVSVTFIGQDGGPTSWRLEYNEPHQCGNYVMGMGRCIGYERAATGGQLSVQTIGLTLSEATRVVRSIRT